MSDTQDPNVARAAKLDTATLSDALDKHGIAGQCYRIQGRDDDGAARLLHEARELAEAGASMLVVELIPSTLGQQLTESLPIPVIGIGAGPGCSGQVLVLHDMLGVTRGKLPRFVRNFMAGADSIESAVRAYVAAVKDGSFPDPAVHGY